MRHLSQAFQTLLCRLSMPALCVTWSWWCTAAAFELARLEVRCTGLTALEWELADEVLLRDRLPLDSSAGGEGKLCDPIVLNV